MRRNEKMERDSQVELPALVTEVESVDIVPEAIAEPAQALHEKVGNPAALDLEVNCLSPPSSRPDSHDKGGTLKTNKDRIERLPYKKQL